MTRVFISYRQTDSKVAAAFLYDQLGDVFGHENLFLDRDTLVAGSWRQQIDASLAQCAVTLLVMGKGWLDARHDDGRRRLDDPEDVHRHEIAQALTRPGMTLIPVLMDGAQMPSPSALPAELQALCERQARSFSYDSAHREVDVRLLVADLQRNAGLVPRRADLMLPNQYFLAPKLDEAAARKAFAGWAGGLMLAPSDFAAKAELGPLTPRWLPVWQARASLNVFWRGRRGDKRETEETVTNDKGELELKTVTKIDWTELQGEFKADAKVLYLVASAPAHADVPTLLDAESARGIGAASQLPAFGNGAAAPAAATVTEGQLAEKIKDQAALDLRSKVRERIAGAEQDVKTLDVQIDKLDAQLVRVPVFEGRYRYGSEEFAVTVNAASAAVGGPSPVSKAKAGAAAGIGVAVVAAIGFAIWYFTRG
jgi:hypothetical protein